MTHRALALLIFCTLLATSSWGATIRISTSGDGVGIDQVLTDEVGQITENADGTFDWVGAWEGGGWTADWDLTLDPDPGVIGVINVTNNSAVQGTFDFLVSLPVTAAFPAGSLMSGSSSLTVADADFVGGGTLQSLAGDSIYTAKIDNVTQRTLFDGPFSLVAPANLTANQGSSFQNENTISPLNVGSLLQVAHRLTLSAGDSVTAQGTFVVVPEPAAAVLFGLGLLGLASRFRRRRVVAGR